eukprot:Tbor_TRINITY_DN533_c0_g1::TRINITY_DN533_c0_g1_i1::g.23362::m.23362/K19678/IFT80; intraflagellar transport protein 80
MRFTVTKGPNNHTEAVTTVSASLGGDIISGSDDYSIMRWNKNGEPIGKVGEFESCVTFVSWMPSAGGGRKKDLRDICIVGFADGTMSLINAASGRVEKTIDAHTGSISAISFAPDGSSIVTAGEDGVLKVWSQAGIQRSVLANVGKCIYAVVWGTESTEMGGESLLYAYGSDVVVKPLKPAVKKQLKWKAHQGIVLCVDWSHMTNLIVTGGEDGIFKVWDPYGRNIFTSNINDHPITSVGFSPDGELFATGSFLSLRICDKTGWTHCCDKVDSGSVLSLSWTADGTQVVCGGGGGAVSIAQLIDRHLHWGHYNVTLSESKMLLVHDVLNDITEELEQRDKVIKLSIKYGYLVVCTTTQCVAYDVNRWATPSMFDLRDAVITLLQSEKVFMIADCSQGISVYTYEGRSVCNVKVAVSLRPEMVGHSLVSLAPETIAVRDPADHKKVVFYDGVSGKPMKDMGISHHLDIIELRLSQSGTLIDRKVAFVDKNRDLYLASLQGGSKKIATMASSIKWHDTNETLVAISDCYLVTWYLPSVVFVDRDLLARTKWVRDDGTDEFSSNDIIQDFSRTRISVRRGTDGALLTFGVSPYPSMIFAHVARHDWDGAVRLSRFLNDEMVWSVLTVLAVKNSELRVAVIGYGALGEMDKVRFMQNVKDIPSREGRQAELAVFARKLEEAEKILLQAGLVYRAIDLHTRLYNWERALEVAVERRTHIDTVLGRRRQYLEAVGRKEHLDKFKQLGNTEIDWDVIDEKVKQEIQKEKQRPGAAPYQ